MSINLAKVGRNDIINYEILLNKSKYMFNQLYKIVRGLNKKYPEGNNPFKIITRLAEECGELAKEVNHFEKTGIKIKKYGQPNKQKMAKEIQDVIRCALQITKFYKIEKELKESIKNSYKNLEKSRFI